MSDFVQNGVIATLHKLTERPVEALEAELAAFSERHPMVLVLPSLFSELEGQALPRIVQALKEVPYLSEIVVGPTPSSFSTLGSSSRHCPSEFAFSGTMAPDCESSMRS